AVGVVDLDHEVADGIDPGILAEVLHILRPVAGNGDGRGASGHQLGLVDAGSALLVLRSLLDLPLVGGSFGGVGGLSLADRGRDGILLLGGGAASGQGQAGQGGDCGGAGDAPRHGSLLCSGAVVVRGVIVAAVASRAISSSTIQAMLKLSGSWPRSSTLWRT